MFVTNLCAASPIDKADWHFLIQSLLFRIPNFPVSFYTQKINKSQRNGEEEEKEEEKEEQEEKKDKQGERNDHVI